MKTEKHVAAIIASGALCLFMPIAPLALFFWGFIVFFWVLYLIMRKDPK